MAGTAEVYQALQELIQDIRKTGHVLLPEYPNEVALAKAAQVAGITQKQALLAYITIYGTASHALKRLNDDPLALRQQLIMDANGDQEPAASPC